MFEAFAAGAALASLALLALPIWTALVLRRLSRQTAALAARVEALEAAATPAHAARAASPSSTPATAPAAQTAAPQAAPHAPAAQAAPGPQAAQSTEQHAAGDDAREPMRAEPAVSTSSHESPAGASTATRTTAPALDLERRIGGRWLLYAGLLTLLVGISFFLKYAFDNAWVDARGRVSIGLAAGLALTWGGLRLARRDLRAFGVALTGAGFATLYLSIYAAVALYALVGSSAAFAATCAVTLGAVWLAHRERAQSLALVGIGGGFLAPFLVGTAEAGPAMLLAYEALLVWGSLLLVRRHGWLGLAAFSYVLTFTTLAWWAAAHYREADWLVTFAFLTVLCLLFVAMLRRVRTVGGPRATVAAALLWTAPPAYHLAALVLTFGHPPALHLYVIVFSVVGVMLTTEPHRPWIRLLVLLASVAPLFGSYALPSGPSWLVANTVTIVLVCGVYLWACVDRVIRQGEALSTADLATLHLAGLALYGLLDQATWPLFASVRGLLAVAVAACASGIAWRLRGRDETAATHAVALALTLLAIGVAVQTDGRSVVIGWAAEGAAVMWMGLRIRNVVFRAGGLLLWLAAIAHLTTGYFDTPTAFTAIVNERSLATLFVVATGYLVTLALSRRPVPEGPGLRLALHLACGVLALLWISAEIQSYWEVRGDRPQAYLYEQLMLSLGWGLYGAAAVVAGLWRAYAPLRYIGIAVIVLTVMKVFLIDMWGLGGIYRVIGFVALGVLLVLVSYLYQQARGEAADEREA